jgi:acyl-coenzyme A thioesterase PaaI-like protein
LKNGAQVKNVKIPPADREMLIVEFKVDFPKPAKTDCLIAVGEVVQAGER